MVMAVAAPRHRAVVLFGYCGTLYSLCFFCMVPLVPCGDLYYGNSITLMMCTTKGDIRQPTWNHSAQSQLKLDGRSGKLSTAQSKKGEAFYSAIEEVESFLQRKLDRRSGKLSTAQSKKWKAFYSASLIEEGESFLQRNRRSGKLSTAQSKKSESFLQRNRRSGKLSTAQSKKWEAFYSAIEEVGSFLQSTSSPEMPLGMGSWTLRALTQTYTP